MPKARAHGNGFRRSRKFLRLRRDSVLPVLSLACVYAVYLISGTLEKNSRQNVDPLSALIPAWSLAERGTLNIPEYLRTTPWIAQYSDMVLSDRMPGVILWATPFYWAVGSPEGPTFGPAAVASATAAVAYLTVLHRVLRRVINARDALIGTLLVALGTATWTVSASALWAHGPDQLWLTLGVLALACERYLGAGFAFAAAIFTRPHLAIVAATTGIWAGVQQRSVLVVLKVGMSSALGLLGILVYNGLVFEQWTLLVGIYGERPGEASGNLTTIDGAALDLGMKVAGTLLSPTRGVLVMSPFLLFLIPGLGAAWKASPGWVRSSAVGGTIYMIVQLIANAFHGGSYFFSYRLPLEWLTLCTPLLAVAWREWTSAKAWTRWGFLLSSVLSISQHAIGALVFVDTLSNDPREWSRYMPGEGLHDASGSQVVLIAAVVVLTTGVGVALLQRADKAPEETSTLDQPTLT